SAAASAPTSPAPGSTAERGSTGNGAGHTVESHLEPPPAPIAVKPRHASRARAESAEADSAPTPATPVETATAEPVRGTKPATAAEKDYGAALAELRAGYALDARREFLFAEAQALRLGGDCKSAVPLYQQFLKSGPEDVQVNATHIALGRCAAQMAAAPAPP